ncbi:Protein CYP-33C1 [Aphelenchoides avenae]|nr:Protein CYP-33C1 [Aphelenchus avenae]
MILLLGLCLIATLVFYNFYWKRRNLPPGPIPLPLLGNIPTIARNHCRYGVFKQWAKEYGPVFTYWMGEKPIVAVTDFQTIQEAFNKDGYAYAGSDFFTDFFQLQRGVLNGIFNTDGEVWRENRRFALQALREYGMGRAAAEDLIMVEVDHIVRSLDKALASRVKEHDIWWLMDLAVGSVINQMLFGYRFSDGREAEFVKMKERLDDMTHDWGQPMTSLVMEWPALRHLPVFSTTYKRISAKFQWNMRSLQEQIDEFKAKFDVIHADDSKGPLTFAGAYLRTKKEADDKGEAGSALYRDNALAEFAFDLWNAGQETTSTTLRFAVLFLLLDVDAQEKLQAELDSVVGPGDRVSMAHKAKLPYTAATINEVQRLCNLLPINVVHRTMRDVELNGHKLPKGTYVVPQISAIFPEPEKFKPERFLDEEGKLRKIDAFVPFSVGKRVCAGEGLARAELFLIIANLFHAFKVRAVDPLKPPTSAKVYGFTAQPHPFTIRIERRHNANNGWA